MRQIHSKSKQVCWISLHSDRNLRGPHVARQQQLSTDICCGPAPDLSSKPAGRRCCCRSMAQTDGRTDEQADGGTLDRFMTLTAYHADCVIIFEHKRTNLFFVVTLSSYRLYCYATGGQCPCHRINQVVDLTSGFSRGTPYRSRCPLASVMAWLMIYWQPGTAAQHWTGAPNSPGDHGVSTCVINGTTRRRGHNTSIRYEMRL